MWRWGWAGALACSAFAAVAAVAACDEKVEPFPASSFADASPEAATSGLGPIFDASLPPPDGGSLLDAACATGTARALRDPLYMLIVLDASGSMVEDGKWPAISSALGGFIDNLAARKDPTFGLGLTIFSDQSDPTAGKGPYTSMDVPIAAVDFAQASRLEARIAAAKPRFDTPTYAVLSGQYPLLSAYAPSAPLPPGGKKVLVFMTDGVPYPDDAGTEKDQSVTLVGNELAAPAPNGPITTVAVGIGYYFPYSPTTYDPVFMARMAVAGGVPNQPCDPTVTSNPSQFCHFQVTPLSDPTAFEQEFIVALDRIRSRVASCNLTLDRADGGARVEPDKANVVFIDDRGYQTVVPEDPVDGWTYDDPLSPSRVILHGKSCDALKANVDGTVTVVLGCDTLVK